MCSFSRRVCLERKSKDTRVAHASRIYGKLWNTYGDGTSNARWAEDLRCWIIVQRATDCALTAREAESANLRLSESIIKILPVKLLRRALNEMRSFETIFAKMAEQLSIVGSPVHVTIRRTLDDPLARIYMIWYYRMRRVRFLRRRRFWRSRCALTSRVRIVYFFFYLVF